MLSLLRKIRHRFRLYAEKLNPLQFNVDQAQQSDLLIIDNIYPHPLSDWRYIEFNEYLKAFNQVHIYTGVIEGNRIVVPAQYAEHKQWLQQNHGTLLQGNHKVEALSEQANINAKLAYCLFYHNLSYVFPLLERYQIPFVFTLYPGGRFALYDHTVRENLRRYTSSPLFRHLFVNMPNIYQYAREQLGVPASKLTLCYGGPIFTNNLAFSSYPLSRYTIQPLRICFAAHQYMPMALNKGYDVFCKLAQAFEKYPDIQFTVIGGLHSGDSFFAPLPNIAYAGELEAEALDECFSRMHIVVSPVRSHVLNAGNFDGFPTGAALRAILRGCVYVGTDPEDNAHALGLVHGKQVLLTSDRVSEIAQHIIQLYNNRQLLYEIASAGQQKFMELCAFEENMQKRVNILKQYINP